MNLKMSSEYLFLIPLLLIIVILLTFCSKNLPIVGCWQNSKGEIVHFYNNGTVEGLMLKEHVIDGTFEVSNDTLKIEFQFSPDLKMRTFLQIDIVRLTQDSLIMKFGEVNWKLVRTD